MSKLPSGWAVARIGDLISAEGAFVDGDWVESKDQDPEGDVRLIQLADIGDGAFRDRSSRFLTSSRASELRCTYLLPGDVLVARMPDPLGRACIFPGVAQPAVTAVDVCVVRPGPGGVDPRWLMWAINAPQFRTWISELQSGTTRKRISRKNLATIELPVPPLNEQRRISAVIEEQFSRLDAARESVGRAEQRSTVLRRVAHSRAVSGDWPTVALGDLAERITKGTTPTSIGHDFAASGVLFVKAESLVDGVVDQARCARIGETTHEVLARSQLAENDVLITIAGTLGRIGVVRTVDVPANTNQAVSLIRLRDPSLVPWLLTWLKGPNANDSLATGGRGVGLQNLNLKQIAQIQVPMPPPEEQRRIVDEVGQLLSVVDAMRSEIEVVQRRSAGLRRAILERAFRGELVPQDPGDEQASVLLKRIAAHRPATMKKRKVIA